MPETAKNTLDPIRRSLKTPYGETDLTRQEVLLLLTLKHASGPIRSEELASGLRRTRVDRIPNNNHVSVVINHFARPKHKPERISIVRDIIGSNHGIYWLTEPEEMEVVVEDFGLTEGEDYYEPKGVRLSERTILLDMARDTLCDANREIDIDPTLRRISFAMTLYPGKYRSAPFWTRLTNRIFGTDHARNTVSTKLTTATEEIPFFRRDSSHYPIVFAIHQEVVPGIYIPNRRRLFL